ncbi:MULTISPECIES: Na+/H+ antiporter subunit E [unclassified Arthrobacter]|uniref:Na+/H+ antiporter subunit E n=1 Tax=unclassified Arthrobacter TaxID=235627 RepID=UPI0006F3A49D|nr:Na+/H+ antiporter subunit E [Arthrobacter sp. Leaf234]KQO03482.1 cation:proton antiporter [Arthrobacter sp. Leaf234]
MSRQRIPLITELPLVIWLVLVWGALWQDFGVGNLVFGAIIAYGVVNFFYLPPVELTGRFNVFWLVPFIGRFLVQLVTASVQVFWLGLTRGPELRNAVVAVELRSSSDFLVTATGHALSLIPGSLVLEVDRSTSTLYLHCLNVLTDEDAQDIREEVRATEAWLIRIMGTRTDLDALLAEERA